MLLSLGAPFATPFNDFDMLFSLGAPFATPFNDTRITLGQDGLLIHLFDIPHRYFFVQHGISTTADLYPLK